MVATDLGLCGRCTWARRITSGKGSIFLRCGRSDTDPRFPKYPPLPLARCAGFEERETAGAPEER